MSRRGRALLWVAQALLCLALAARSGALARLALLPLATLAAGLCWAPRAERLRLTAGRRVERAADGAVEVTVTVRNDGPAPAALHLRDPLPGGVRPHTGSAAVRTLLRPGEEAELAYAFRVPRGRFTWTAVVAVASDPLGLFEERRELPAPAELQVHPELVRLRPLPLQPRRTLPSPGSIPARVGGSGTEFFGVREYQVGDALRWLDWRLTARHPGRLFTREFEQEQIADVGLVLDARAAADHRAGADSLLEHAVRAAASLAEILLRQGHRVSLLVLDETGARVLPGYGRVQLQRILGCLAGVHGQPSGAGRGLDRSFARMFPARSLLVVLSPLSREDGAMLHRLKAHGRQVVVVSPDPIAFQAAAAPRDPVGRLALRAARLERQLGLRAVAQLRIPVVDWQVDRPLYPLLREALRPARGQRPL